MFEIKVNKYIVSVQETEPLISGAVSVYKCRFDFDEFWDGFFRSAVFRVGTMVRTVPLDEEDACDLPWELLASGNIGIPVEVSVYGAKNDLEILPSNWDKLGRVRGGSEPGEDAKAPTPGVYDRLTSLVRVYYDKVEDTEKAAVTAAARTAEDAAAAIAAKTAAQSAYDGVKEALKNLPEGDTLVINDLTTGGASTALSAEMGKVLAVRPNPDLLDNGYFANPVNQRGEYTTTCASSLGYFIDRWKRAGYSSGVLSLGGDGLTIDSTNNTSGSDQLRQSLNVPFPYGTYTLSILVVSASGTGTLSIASASGSSLVSKAYTEPGLHSVTYTGAEMGRIYFGARIGANVTIKAVKLELGSTQTLAHQDADGNWVLNEIPDYGEELAKCQRYYQLFSGEAAMPADPVDYRPNMRTTPAIGTIDIDGVTYWYADAEL